MIPRDCGTERAKRIAALLFVLVVLLVGGCTPFGTSEPAPTASPIPAVVESGQETKVAEIANTATPTQTPTETPLPTDTPVPPSPMPTNTATPEPAMPEPTASPALTVTFTPLPKPTRSPPKPTAIPAFGGKLVFQTTIGGDFYSINADGSGLQRITDGTDPVWSPDGKQIAFVRWRDPRGVWVIDTDGGEWRAFDWSEARWPSWSPDGARILFSHQKGGRTDAVERCFWGFCFTFPAHTQWKLGVIRLSDGDFREPPASRYSLAPIWSPDGERIIYDDEHGLRVQNEDETISYLITHDARDTSPAWSPDGARVAFTRRQHDHWEVYVVDADGRNLRRLTDTPIKPDGEPGNSAAAAWSPDGQYLAFFTDRTGKWEIWVMPVRCGPELSGVGPVPMFPGVLDHLPLEYASVAERAISWTW